MLNDWSSAARAGEECFYAGTQWFADRPQQNQRHTPCAATDLRALVRTLFCLSKQRLPWVPDHDWGEVEAFWRSIANEYPSFARAMDFASHGDYDSLQELLTVLWQQRGQIGTEAIDCVRLPSPTAIAQAESESESIDVATKSFDDNDPAVL